MATPNTKARCVNCGKEKAVMKCGGCLEDFCFTHITEHRQNLSQQLDEIEVDSDVFRQTFNDQLSKPEKHTLIQQIDQWEHDSINKIRSTAEEARQELLKHTVGYFKEIEVKLNQLTNQLRESRQENDFIETDLQQWKQQLNLLKDEFEQPSSVKVLNDSTPWGNKIYINASASSYIPNISANAKWVQNGITVAGSTAAGNGVNQLNQPFGLYVDDDQTIYIADYVNARIIEWKNGATSGRVVAGGNGPGNQANQLSGPTDVILDKKTDSLIICDRSNNRVVRWPRQNGTTGEIVISDIGCLGLTMDKDGYLYVCDYTKHEVRRWKIGEPNGIMVAGGNGNGNRQDQLNGPSYVFIDQEGAIYVTDTENHRVMKWEKGAKEGIVVAGGQGKGSSLTQLSRPFGVLVDQLGTIYVADYVNHRVMRWAKGAIQGSIIVGGNGQGAQANQLCYPIGLSFDKQNNLYVAEYGNHRIQKFHIDPNSNV